jgi:hypothetical protein
MAIKREPTDSRVVGALNRSEEQADALHSNLTDLEARLAKALRKIEEPESDLTKASVAEVSNDSDIVTRIDGITYSMGNASIRVVRLLEKLDV